MERTLPNVRVVVALTAACLLPSLAMARENAGYRYYLMGNAENVDVNTQGLIVLQGGGDAVTENFERMAEKGGHGDFVVLRASGGTDYNELIYPLCKCDSVETIVFESAEAAYDEFVLNTIRNADALFIAGGDQSNYVRFWQGTPVEDAIQSVIAKPAPIGGTSAGMAILGEFVYAAMGPNVTSEVALHDPYFEGVTLTRDFLELPKLGNVITDQHLLERDRMGRTVAFLARLAQDNALPEVRAIAADRETALHIDPATGKASVFGTQSHQTPYVYFLRAVGPPEVCAEGSPLTSSTVEVSRVGPGGTFDIDAWQDEGGTRYSLKAVEGQLESTGESVY